MNKEIIPHYIAKFAQLFGFLDERRYRDYCIKEEFAKMKNNGMKIEQIELELSQRFSTKKYPLQPETIHKIIYTK